MEAQMVGSPGACLLAALYNPLVWRMKPSLVMNLAKKVMLGMLQKVLEAVATLQPAMVHTDVFAPVVALGEGISCPLFPRSGASN